ncbi:alpha/beta fold hydrolase [Streptomyces sp. SID5785]|uniref:alpha/beta fold hydrolase n=1 Tax=Streptomyces sp. SID5785 TaxID=2690309 RepID=UPI001361AD89|nr:alpha/beta fold hydrolase [Streptomyces sp. SID5785]MZD04325.1 alpha/beta fold hydrolase [Streptomyces sp. SID5785]
MNPRIVNPRRTKPRTAARPAASGAHDADTFDAAYARVLADWPHSRTATTVATPFGATHVNTCGPADGAPVVLLPGGGGATSASWAAQAVTLSRTHRVHAVDLVGFPGRSVPAADRPVRTLDDLLAWLTAVLDGLGLGAGPDHRPVDLIGHSYGAWIALHHTLRTPSGVRRLVLLDPTRCFAGFRPEYLLHAAPLLVRPTRRRVRAFLEWETGGAIGRDPDCLALEQAAARFPAARPASGPRPAADALRALDVPTLLLLGGASRTHDAERVAARARAVMPHVTAHVLPGTPHHAMPRLLPAGAQQLMADFLIPGTP